MTSEKAVWRPMTAIEQRAAACLSPSKVTYPVASAPKRMGRFLAAQAACDSPQITDKQAACMWKQVHRFRRQIADKSILAAAVAFIGDES